MRHAERGILAVVLLTAAAALCGAEPTPADNAGTPVTGTGTSSIMAPASGTGLRAPARPKIVGRDPSSFRRPGTLIALMTREIPKVDVVELAKRRKAMAAGERFYLPPLLDGTVVSGASVAPVTRPAAAAGDDDVWTMRFGWLGWSLLVLVVGCVVLAWRLGWFVPFSERERAHASPVVSESGRSRAARAPGPKIELVKRGA